MRKPAQIFLFLFIFGLFFYFDLGRYLSLEELRAHQDQLKVWIESKTFYASILFFFAYVFIAALSLPGAAVMTLAGGALFGLERGLLLSSLASTFGATFAFLLARFFLRAWVQKKVGRFLDAVNKGIQRDGVFYLLSLRLIPVFPFFVVNIVMALTSMRVVPFFFVSLIGMFPGTFVYVNAGTQLAKIHSLRDVASPEIFWSFVLLGVFPLLAQFTLGWLRKRKLYARFQRPKHFDYNLVVIGGGAAGLITTYIAATLKAKVALVEKSKMGGDCLNTGCVPSKTLLSVAKAAHSIHQAREYGLECGPMKLDFLKVMDHVKAVIAEIEPNDSRERYRSLGAECFEATATIQSPWSVDIGGKVVTTRNIVIASGARPIVPDIPGLQKTSFLTSDTVWNLKELPKRFLIVGGGAIGVELAQAFARLGSRVTLIEAKDQLLPQEDPEVGNAIRQSLEADGAQIFLGAKLLSFDVDDAKQFFAVIEQGEAHIRLEYDEVLLALGRKPRLDNLGLENLPGVFDEKGRLQLDEKLRTLYPNVFACGDVSGRM